MTPSLSEVLDLLHEVSNPDTVEFKAKKFNIQAEQTLGVFQKDINAIAKEIGKDKELAIDLYNTKIYEARLLAAKIFPPKLLEEDLMHQWVKDFNNWEITDTFCAKLFVFYPKSIEIARIWVKNDKEFIRRSGFVIMACYCNADKKAPNAIFESFFKDILEYAYDDRIYVRKSVNWALRSIGKRNVDLQRKAIQIAEHLMVMEDKTAKWIGSDAYKELCQENVRISDYPRAIYRP